MPEPQRTDAEKTQSPTDWTRIRERFPVLEHKSYLNSCSYGAMSLDVAQAAQRYLDERMLKGVDWPDWVDHNEALRRSLARLLGADADEVALTSSASAGLNALASALRFDGQRRKVIITDLEFPTNAQIWYAQELRGAQVIRLPAPDGVIDPARFEETIDDQTLLVATSHVCYRNGSRLDVSTLAQLVHQRGAYLLVDDFQSTGTSRLLPSTLGADFVVGGTYKYLLGTAGIAYLFVRSALLESLVPTVTGWFAQRDIFAMDVTGYRPSPTARRFEAGTPPVINTYAAAAGLEIVHQIGLGAIEARVGELCAAIKSEARTAGYRLATPVDPARHGAMIAIRTNDEQRIVSELLARNIVTSCRDGNVRIAPHFYNDWTDVEQLFRALRTQHELLA
jgi:selenocysteine lyase/cysteine desulfurase